MTIKRDKRSTQRLDRTIFSTSRAAEYFRVKELEKMTGQPREKFADVVIKELKDNALDACEAAGVAPEVGIETSVVRGYIIIKVADNGPGIRLKSSSASSITTPGPRINRYISAPYPRYSRQCTQDCYRHPARSGE